MMGLYLVTDSTPFVDFFSLPSHVFPIQISSLAPPGHYGDWIGGRGIIDEPDHD